jgi:pyruvate ferredoxin oxidoreductase beta subunit
MTSKDDYFTSGHNACPGCGAAIAMRHITKAAGPNTIIVNGTGCMEVVSTPYPLTSWKLPYIHVAFENTAAVASGVDSALKAMGKRKDVNVIAIAGDGGTFDIGLQSLSGAMERKQNILYICYDNEGYMNTGVQRSSATPLHADTTTTPWTNKIHGKMGYQKNMPFIMGAHGCYVAVCNIAYYNDFQQKIKKALSMNGPSYIQILTPCTAGWKYNESLSVELSKLAYETNFYPMFEIENGILKLNKCSPVKPISEFLKLQGRFKLDEKDIGEIQQSVDENIKKLSDLDGKRIF